MAPFIDRVKFNGIRHGIQTLRQIHVSGPTAFAVIALMALSGCQKSPSRTIATIQGVNITIIYPNTGPKVDTLYDRDASDNQYWKFAYKLAGRNPRRLEVIVDKLHLQADGKDYGTLKSGDNVVVDMMTGSQVTVNGQNRQPEKKKE